MSLKAQDQQARTLALDVTQSFIVQAPAGSGKTELLIQRYLSLLNIVQKPEEVLAITFTKKAANEMRTRVVRALQAALQPEPIAAHAKKTWQIANAVLKRDQQFNWQIINNPNQLRIQTIDAFCSFLTKQLPLLSQFGAQPNISQYPHALYDKAVTELLKHIEKNVAWSESIANLLKHLDNDLNKLHQLLVALLTKRDQWLSYISLHTDDLAIKARLEKQLANVIQDHLTKVARLVSNDIANELPSLVRYAASNISAEMNESLYACRDLLQMPDTSANALTQWRGIAFLLLTKNNTWRKRFDVNCGFPALTHFKNAQEKSIHQSYRERMKALLESLADQQALQILLANVLTLPDAHYAENVWQILQSLLHMLKISLAELRLVFQQHGEIDFIENAQAALSALGNEENPTDLSLALDYQIKHILIDEFQDTSFSQLQLLRHLTMGWDTADGRTLFIVGDPMQSIYRFREAEVGIYIRMFEQGFGHIQIKPLKLYINFRAQASIVEWNNAQFEKIFPHFSDIATGAVPYSHSVVNQADASVSTDISLFGFEGDTIAQADKIVSFITDNLTQFPDDKIAILVRSRNHLSEIIPALKKANIAYHAVEIDYLASQQFIQDLLTLTCALLHPYDRIAWLALLRAPWCGLTLSDLHLLTAEHPTTAIIQLLQNENMTQKLSVDGFIRLKRLQTVLLNAIKNRNRLTLRAWVETTWLMLGGPACLNEQSELEDVTSFFDLLEEMSADANIVSVSALKARVDKLYASKEAEQAKVQIMTIHAAKGLEFDTVIIPHIERKMPTDDKPLLTWMEQPLSNDQTALLIAPIQATGADKDKTYEYIAQRQKLKAYYETDRLFYVATTRAKKRLCILFNIKFKEDQTAQVDSGSFLEKLWPLIKRQSNLIISQVTSTTVETTPALHLTRVTSDWCNPVSYENTWHYLRQSSTGFRLPDNSAQLTGTVFHRLSQLLSENGIGWWQQQSKQSQLIFLKQQLTANGLPAALCVGQSQQIQTMINNMLTDPRGQWILSPHQQAQSEYALTVMIGNRVERIVIDRTFIGEDNTRWIIDYKTTALNHTDLNEFLINQYQTYIEKMTKYASALQMLEQKSVRLGLYFPAIPAWKEWDATA